MERKEYLVLCRKSAMLKRGLYSQPLEVPVDCRIVYDGREYYAAALETSFDSDGNPVQTAVLHEVERRTLFHVPLDKVETAVGTEGSA